MNEEHKEAITIALGTFLDEMRQALEAHLQDNKFLIGLDIKIGGDPKHEPKLKEFGTMLNEIMNTQKSTLQ